MAISKGKQQTEALKAEIFRTFNELQEPGPGGQPMPHSLIEWARSNPKELYTVLLPRLLPKPVEISAEAGTQLLLVYQVGEERVMIGEDGQPLPLPDPDPSMPRCWKREPLVIRQKA
jgi:hypothetical protein